MQPNQSRHKDIETYYIIYCTINIPLLISDIIGIVCDIQGHVAYQLKHTTIPLVSRGFTDSVTSFMFLENYDFSERCMSVSYRKA